MAMFDMRNKFYDRTLLRLRVNVDWIHGILAVKGGASLVNSLKGLFLLAGATITSGRIRFICLFCRLCVHLIRTQGAKGLVKFLKASGTSIQQSLGGQLVPDGGKLGCRFGRTSSGLPRWIPEAIRIRIRLGDTVAIKTTLTLVNLYRVLEFPGTLKTSTITDPSRGTGGLNVMIISFIPRFLRLFVFKRFDRRVIWTTLNHYGAKSAFQMFKGGPGARGVFGEWNTMPWVMLRALSALRANPVLWSSISLLAEAFQCSPFAKGVAFAIHLDAFRINGRPLVSPLSHLGKLGIKNEAAGKVRVFAMVDAWTQWVLYPLHSLIFKILKDVPMDGTFDQLKPLEALKASSSLYSLDLTAATDRLPISLQRELLGQLLDREVATAWVNLLVGRSYRLHDKSGFKDLKYAVGQPMGALSS